jgi:hypothetical protein
MKTETTTESTGVIMPKCAKARRTQTNLVKQAQNPERKKRAKTIFRTVDMVAIVLRSETA